VPLPNGKASESGDQGAESALFAAGFEAFPLRVGVDLVQIDRCGSARRIGGDLVASDWGVPTVSARQSPATKGRAAL
jgi:hypothetical protein